METMHIVLVAFTLVLNLVFLPTILLQLKNTRQYASMFDPDKIKAYIALMEGKHGLELTQAQRTNIENMRKISEFRNQISTDYQKLLVETTQYLRELDAPDKEQLIKKYFGSHADFFLYTACGQNPKGF